jgi:dipeptidase
MQSCVAEFQKRKKRTDSANAAQQAYFPISAFQHFSISVFPIRNPQSPHFSISAFQLFSFSVFVPFSAQL